MRVGETALVLTVAWAGCGFADPAPSDSDQVLLPDADLCDPVRNWDLRWEAWEADVVERVRDLRRDGARCGDFGPVAAAPDVKLSGALICAARAHAADMASREFFGHDDPEGLGPDDRTSATGVSFLGVHEDILAGAQTPRQAMSVWISDGARCADLLVPDFNRIGVGYVGDFGVYDGYWVLLLGIAPPRR